MKSTIGRVPLLLALLALPVHAPVLAGNTARHSGKPNHDSHDHGRGRHHGHPQYDSRGRHHRHVESFYHRYDGPPRHVRPWRRHHHVDFVVPRTIHRTDWVRYRPYRLGSVPFRPHRHDHVVFAFPVLTRAGYVNRLHDYCEGERFRSVDDRRRGIAIRIGF